MTASIRDQVMVDMEASLATFLPQRVVTRQLQEIGAYKAEDLARGILVLVATGGGSFANWQGREGELGTLRFKAVGFLQVDEKATALDIERAEFALLEDFLRWVAEIKPPPLDSLYPGDYAQSSQQEHPHGWFALDMEARHL